MTDIAFTMRQAKTMFKRQALMSAEQRAATRGLRRIGAMTMKVARRSMRKGRFLRVAEYPPELRALMHTTRDQTSGRFRASTDDVLPKPRLHSRIDQPPLYYGKQLRTHTLFFVDPMRLSVVTGPAQLSGMKQRGTPELLEHGGTRTENVGTWKAFYKKGKRLIRLVNKQTRSITYKGREFMESAHDITVGTLVPKIWEDSIR